MNNNTKIKRVSYILAGAAFIPFIGLITGLLALVYSFKLIEGRHKVWFISIIGMIFSTFVTYKIVTINNLLSEKMVTNVGDLAKEVSLPDIIVRIEYYKLVNGSYPEGISSILEAIKANSGTFNFVLYHENDLGSVYYQLSEDKVSYHLLLTGPDKTPYTKDDILPYLLDEELKKIGYKNFNP